MLGSKPDCLSGPPKPPTRPLHHDGVADSSIPIETLRRHYAALVRMAREDAEITASHSVEEAYGRHRAKAHEK